MQMCNTVNRQEQKEEEEEVEEEALGVILY
jgi:hypothetical protein